MANETIVPEVLDEVKTAPKMINHMKDYGLNHAQWLEVKDNKTELAKIKKAFEKGEK